MIINRRDDVDRNIEKADLNVCESGMAYIDEDWYCDDTLSIYNRLYYIIEGEGANVANSKEKTAMHPGHIYLIPAGYRYKYWCEGNVKKVYFHISIKRDDGYDAFSKFNRVGELYAPEIVERVSRLYESNEIKSAFSLKGELFDTMARMAEKYEYDLGDGDSRNYSKILRTATRYIQNNLSISLTRKEIAEHCRVSPGTVAKCFKNELGISVGKYIDDLVFMEANRRLTYTDDLIGTISEELGFCDQFYFSRRFTELYYVTPRKFRHKMQNLR